MFYIFILKIQLMYNIMYNTFRKKNNTIYKIKKIIKVKNLISLKR